jgi:RimJ/RimL family protein N-acetyltransferase
MVDTATPSQRAQRQLVRVSGAVRRHGLVNTAKLAGQRWVFLHEAHIWYQLDLEREHSRKEMPEGLEFVEASAEQIQLVERLPSLTADEARKRVEDGASMWFVLQEGRPAFACWTFTRRTPVPTAPTGWVALPDHVDCLEDSVTSPDFRGRGVAPAAWTALTDRLRERGVSALITKVAIENVASCRAVNKASFVHVATMEVTRLGPRVDIRLHHAGAGVGPHLHEQLAR